MRSGFALLVGLAGLSLIGCMLKKTPETPAIVKRISTPASALGPGDAFEVQVYDEKELSGMYMVSSTGTITFPLIGRVYVEGLNSSDASELLQQKLAEKYIKHPQVSIFIKEYNSKKVSIFGQVQKPGTFKFEDSMTIIQAVSMAGGFTPLASKDNTNVTRLVEGLEKKFSVPVEAIAQGKTRNFYLEPGDIIYVPESLW